MFIICTRIIISYATLQSYRFAPYEPSKSSCTYAAVVLADYKVFTFYISYARSPTITHRVSNVGGVTFNSRVRLWFSNKRVKSHRCKHENDGVRLRSGDRVFLGRPIVRQRESKVETTEVRHALLTVHRPPQSSVDRSVFELHNRVIVSRRTRHVTGRNTVTGVLVTSGKHRTA